MNIGIPWWALPRRPSTVRPSLCPSLLGSPRLWRFYDVSDDAAVDCAPTPVSRPAVPSSHSFVRLLRHRWIKLRAHRANFFFIIIFMHKNIYVDFIKCIQDFFFFFCLLTEHCNWREIYHWIYVNLFEVKFNFISILLFSE